MQNRLHLYTLLFLFPPLFLQAQKPDLIIPSGHASFVDQLAVSPDGQYALSGGADGRVKLWNLEGKEIKSLRLNRGIWVSCVDFSPDSQYILAGGMAGAIRAWDREGNLRFDFSETTGSEVLGLASFLPELGVLAATDQYLIRFGPDASVEQLVQYEGEPVLKMARFSPDHSRVLATEGRQAYVFDTSGLMVALLELETEAKSISWLSNEAALVCEPHRILGWDLEAHEYEELYSQKADEGIALSFAILSPDSRYLLAGMDTYDETGAFTGGQILLSELETEALQLFPSPHYVYNGAFSGSGNHFIFLEGIATSDNQVFSRMKLYDTEGKQVAEFQIDGAATPFKDVAIRPSGDAILTAMADSTVRAWNLTNNQLSVFGAHGGGVQSIDISGDGRLVLTTEGFLAFTGKGRMAPQIGRLKLWDGAGELLNTFDSQLTGPLRAAALSPNGDAFLTADTSGILKLWSQDGTFRRVLSYTNPTSGQAVAFEVITFSPDGQHILAGSPDTSLAVLWRADGTALQTFALPRQEKSRAGSVSALACSPDGRLVFIGYNDNPRAALWDFSGRLLHLFPAEGINYATAVGFSSDGQQLIIGQNNGQVEVWDLDGQQQYAFDGHDGPVAAIEAFPGAPHFITVGEDERLKFWSLAEAQELATLTSLNSTDWAAQAPNGLFDATPGAMQGMYYVVGVETVELEQLKERYYEPGLLQKLLGFSDDVIRKVEGLKQVALYPRTVARIENHQLLAELEARSGGIGKLSLFINGKEVLEDANPGRKTAMAISLKQYSRYFLQGRENTIELRAYNGDNWLKSPPYTLSYQPPIASPGDPAFLLSPDPHLYAIIIGTADYSGDQLDLKFPDKDAAAIAQALQAAGGALFEGRVHIQLLSTEAEPLASKENIRAAFQAFAQKAQPIDLLLVYFSGHGLTYGAGETAQFYYITRDIGSEDLSDPEIRGKYAVSSQELTQWLTGIAAQKQVMILDACNSGKVVEDLLSGKKALSSSQIRALDRMKDRTGMFVLAGSAADKASYEASRYGQGLLTFSLLQGMSGLALRDGKYVDVMQLFQYARDRVPVLAEEIGGIQTPMLAFPAGGESFDIGIVDETVRIPVTQAKPVFVRNNFQEESAFDDVLGLTQAVEDYFLDITARGAQAELIYIDVPRYKDAFSIKGRYQLEGEAISLQAKLFKGNTPLGDIQAEGTAGELNALVEQILQQAFSLLQKR